MTKVESHKRLGFDFIGAINVEMENNGDAIVTKFIEMFDCNGEFVGSVTQELIDLVNSRHALSTVYIDGGVSNDLAVELLGSDIYTFNEYVYV